jgi:hypothetical protein
MSIIIQCNYIIYQSNFPKKVIFRCNNKTDVDPFCYKHINTQNCYLYNHIPNIDIISLIQEYTTMSIITGYCDICKTIDVYNGNKYCGRHGNKLKYEKIACYTGYTGYIDYKVTNDTSCLKKNQHKYKNTTGTTITTTTTTITTITTTITTTLTISTPAVASPIAVNSKKIYLLINNVIRNIGVNINEFNLTYYERDNIKQMLYLENNENEYKTLINKYYPTNKLIYDITSLKKDNNLNYYCNEYYLNKIGTIYCIYDEIYPSIKYIGSSIDYITRYKRHNYNHVGKVCQYFNEVGWHRYRIKIIATINCTNKYELLFIEQCYLITYKAILNSNRQTSTIPSLRNEKIIKIKKIHFLLSKIYNKKYYLINIENNTRILKKNIGIEISKYIEMKNIKRKNQEILKKNNDKSKTEFKIIMQLGKKTKGRRKRKKK